VTQVGPGFSAKPPGQRRETAELVNPLIGLRSPAIQFGGSV